MQIDFENLQKSTTQLRSALVTLKNGTRDSDECPDDNRRKFPMEYFGEVSIIGRIPRTSKARKVLPSRINTGPRLKKATSQSFLAKIF